MGGVALHARERVRCAADGADGIDDGADVRVHRALRGGFIVRADRGVDRTMLAERPRDASRLQYRAKLIADGLRLQDGEEHRRRFVPGNFENCPVKLGVELRIREQVARVVTALHFAEDAGEGGFARRIDATRRVACDEPLERGARFENFDGFVRRVRANANAAIGFANDQALLFEQCERAPNDGTIGSEVPSEIEFDETLVGRDFARDDRPPQQVRDFDRRAIGRRSDAEFAEDWRHGCQQNWRQCGSIPLAPENKPRGLRLRTMIYYYGEMATLGVATVYEASGKAGLIDIPLHRLAPRTAVAGPARTVRCGQDDNLMVHAAIERIVPGDVLVLTMPEPSSVALVGDLLLTQMIAAGAAGVLVDAAVRDADELATMAVPVWARFISVRGATKRIVGDLDLPVLCGGTTIAPGDIVVLDGDGACAVARARFEAVLAAARARAALETANRARYTAGERSFDINGFRAIVAAGGA